MTKKTFFYLCCFFLITLSAVAENNFWEEYKMGVQFERAERWALAREHLLKAAALNPVPRRRERRELFARGMNIYDPYAHLAFCEFKLGMLERAAAHAELSRKAGITPVFLMDELKAHIKQAADAKIGSTNSEAPTSAPLKMQSSHPVAPTRISPSAQNPAAQNISIQTKQAENVPQSQTTSFSPQTAQLAKPESQSGLKPVQQEPAKAQSVNAASSAPVSERRNWFENPLFLLIPLAGLLLAFVLFQQRGKRALKPEDTPTEWIAENPKLVPSTPIKTPTPVSLAEVLPLAKALPEGIPKEFNGYRLEGILGRGGMGTTYLAVRKRDGAALALKIPHEHLLDNQEFVTRFLRESALGSTLHHPNIIRIYESGRIGEKPFIAMEVLKGETLEKKLRMTGKLPVQTSLEIARDIALALDYARLKGIVHRDLKPENIMLLDRGGLKVMDYGIAKMIGSPGLTSTEAYLGTPAYSAPEAVGPGVVDQQSDLYSLGIILYRMLAGKHPFDASHPVELLQMHQLKPLPEIQPELKVPDEVFRLVKTLAAKSKSDRYANAEAFLIDLNTVFNRLA